MDARSIAAGSNGTTQFQDAIGDYFDNHLAVRYSENLRVWHEDRGNVGRRQRPSQSFKETRAPGLSELTGDHRSRQNDGLQVGRARAATITALQRREMLESVAEEQKRKYHKVCKRIGEKLQEYSKHAQERTCRICFCPEEADDDNAGRKVKNPLIAPCQCTGSARYIHLECL